MAIPGSGDREESMRSQMFWSLGNLARQLLFAILAVGPIPRHVAFIMDGNRRYGDKQNLTAAAGYNAGFLSVVRMLKYCYELGVRYVTVYAFSIDNYRRRPEEVQLLMNLMQIRMEEMVEVEGLAHQLGIRVRFAGNLGLLTEQLRESAHRVTEETARNARAVLTVCVAYTSTDEIASAVRKSCDLRACRRDAGGDGAERKEGVVLGLGDIERNMYMAVAPEPDVVVRTSGETRLSNFLLWQSGGSLLHSPSALWPEIGLWHLVWAVIIFQRSYAYLEKKRQLSPGA